MALVLTSACAEGPGLQQQAELQRPFWRCPGSVLTRSCQLSCHLPGSPRSLGERLRAAGLRREDEEEEDDEELSIESVIDCDEQPRWQWEHEPLLLSSSALRPSEPAQQVAAPQQQATAPQAARSGRGAEVDHIRQIVMTFDERAPASTFVAASYPLSLLKRRFDRFCPPGETTLGPQEFSALLMHFGCCSREAAPAFFAAFARPGSSACEGGAAATRLGFRDFAQGALAADPADGTTIYAKAKYLVDFFALAPKQCFKFETSLLHSRFHELRTVFLAAHRGAPHFTCLHVLYVDQCHVFQHVIDFL